MKPSVLLQCSRNVLHQQFVPDESVTFVQSRTEPDCETAGSVVCTATADYLGMHGEDVRSLSLNALGHDWGEWVVTKAPTQEEGEKTHTCKRENCAKTETVTIPKLQTFAITFAPGDGTGEVPAAQAINDGQWHLPQCGFTGPDGKAFRAWSLDGSEYWAGASFTPSADVTFTALWSEAKYTGPTGIHYVEVGDSQSFTYTANEGCFHQAYFTQGFLQKAKDFLRHVGINSSDLNDVTEFTATFAPTYFPEGKEVSLNGASGTYITYDQCETTFAPSIFWHGPGVGDYEFPLADKFVVVPGRTSIDLGHLEGIGSINMEEGTELVLSPVVRNVRGHEINAQNGYAIDVPEVSFASSDEEVASVSADGKITALRPGTATVTASFGGNKSYLAAQASVDVVVPRPKLDASLVLDPVEPVEPNGTVTVRGRLLDGEGAGIAGQTLRLSADPFFQSEDTGNEYLFPEVQTETDGSFLASGFWREPDQFRLIDFPVTVSLSSELYKSTSASATVSVVNPAINVSGIVVWDDGNNADGTRPQRTWLTIRRTDGEPVADKGGNTLSNTVEITDSTGAALGHTWEDLPKHADVGADRTLPITYEVFESDADGTAYTPGNYEQILEGDAQSGFVITNRHIPIQTDIVVTTLWNDSGDAEGKRPASATLHLDKRPEVVFAGQDSDIKDAAASQVASQANGWKAAWRGLPYNEPGLLGQPTAIGYVVREDAMSDYYGTVTEQKLDSGLRFTVVWNESVADADKPSSVQIELYDQSGQQLPASTAFATAEDGWSGTLDSLGVSPSVAARYSARMVGGIDPRDAYLQMAVIRNYTVTNTLIPIVELEIESPPCGTVVDEKEGYSWNLANGMRDPAAQINRPVGRVLTEGWDFLKSKDDVTVDWLKWFEFVGWDSANTMLFPITLTDGYSALGYLRPSDGSPMPATIHLIVNGEELPAEKVKIGTDRISFSAHVKVAHSLARSEGAEPTCTAAGTQAHWECSECGKLFADGNGENEVSAGDLTIPATGHDWGPWTVTKEATEAEEGEETRVCSHDATHTETRTVPTVDPSDVSYRCTAGDQESWTRGRSEGLEFVFKRSVNDDETFARFAGVQVDGEGVAPSSYVARSGSLVLVMKPTYLETLAVGSHTLTASFTDGSVMVDFSIEQKEEPPAEDDADKPSTNEDGTSTPGAEEPRGGDAPSTPGTPSDPAVRGDGGGNAPGTPSTPRASSTPSSSRGQSSDTSSTHGARATSTATSTPNTGGNSGAAIVKNVARIASSPTPKTGDAGISSTLAGLAVFAGLALTAAGVRRRRQ